MGSVFEIYNSGNTFRVNHATWEAGNTVRQAKNKREASDVALKEFTRTLANQRRVEAAGEDYNANVANLGKVLNQTTITDMNLTMAASQQHGALAAQAAALGVGGTSVDLVDKATELQRNIQQELNTSERKSAAIFGSKANSEIMDRAWQGIDNSHFQGNFDYTTQLEPRKLKNRWGAMIAVGVMSYFGGPQAGQGTADVILASNKAANGDYESAKAYYDNAAQNAAGAFKEWSSLQDDSGDTKSWFQAIRDRNKSSDEALKGAQKVDVNANIGDDTADFGSWWS